MDRKFDDLGFVPSISAEWRGAKDYLSLTSARLSRMNEFLSSEEFVGLDEHRQALFKMQASSMEALEKDLSLYIKILEKRLEN